MHTSSPHPSSSMPPSLSDRTIPRTLSIRSRQSRPISIPARARRPTPRLDPQPPSPTNRSTAQPAIPASNSATPPRNLLDRPALAVAVDGIQTPQLIICFDSSARRETRALGRLPLQMNDVQVGGEGVCLIPSLALAWLVFLSFFLFFMFLFRFRFPRFEIRDPGFATSADNGRLSPGRP